MAIHDFYQYSLFEKEKLFVSSKMVKPLKNYLLLKTLESHQVPIILAFLPRKIKLGNQV